MKQILISLFLLVSILQIQAQDSTKLIIYRPKSYEGSAMRVKLTLGEQQIKLRNNELIEINVPVGDYRIRNERRLLFYRKSDYLLSAKANKTYYIRYRFIRKTWYSADDFLIVDEDFAKAEIAKRPLKRNKLIKN